MGIFDILKLRRRPSTGRGLRPSPIRPPMFVRREKKVEPKEKAAQSIFSKTGWTTKKKLKEQVLEKHTEVRRIPSWHIRQKKAEVFEKYFPEGEKKKHYSKKDVKARLRALQKQLKREPHYEHKETRKQIDIVKKASGL